MSKLWGEEELRLLRDKYGTMRMVELLPFFPGRSRGSILWQAQKHGLKADPDIVLRKTTLLRPDFFSNPNPVAAYWAGLLAADGSIYKDVITLYQNSFEVVERFRQAVGYSGKVQHRYRVSCGHSYAVSITSKTFVHDLRELYSLTPAKSLTLSPPRITDRTLALSFLTGFIDGDGWISLRTDRRYSNLFLELGMLGPKPFLEWAVSWFPTQVLIRLRADCKSEFYKASCSFKKARVCLAELDNVPPEVREVRFSRKWSKIERWKELTGKELV